MSISKSTRKKSRLIRQSPAKNQKELDKLARIAALEARQAELEKRIAELERETIRQLPKTWEPSPLSPADEPGWPTQPKLPFRPQWPNIEDIEDGKCHVCGNKWKDMSLYVCNNNSCPNRVVYCSATSSSALQDLGGSISG